MVHPDKSNLPPDYFLFYKKAFELILEFYKTNSRQHQTVPEEPIQYKPIYQTDKQTSNQIQGVAKTMNSGQYQQEFNRLFDEHMYRKPDESKNQWFKEDNPTFQYQGKVSAGNMSNVFQDIKREQQNNMLATYRGVREMNSSGNAVSSFYDEDEGENDGVYISSDPFSKLKYDDLRKVHKDQTIFAVSENDINNMKQYSSVEEYSSARSIQNLTPLEKQQAEMAFANRERERQEMMMKRQHQSNLQSMEFAKKNQMIQARFLQLGNGNT